MPASRSPEHAEEPTPKDGFLYTAGPALTSGAAQAILFNPVDRALYVRVKFRRRRFLDRRNFERPFQGFMNAAVYRTLVGASYMFWQDSARIYVQRYLPDSFQAEASPQLNSFLIGFFAGSVNGLALNTLQAVKFRMWNTDERRVTFARTARLMYKEGGVPIFFRGCVTTMVRDCVFGIVYETARRAQGWRDFFDSSVTATMEYDWLGRSPKVEERGGSGSGAEDESARLARANVSTAPAMHVECSTCAFISNLIAAVMASMMSSPFNYVRSVVYGTPPGSIPLGYWSLLKSFYMQFFYIWRNGKSYTDLYRIPQLYSVEGRITAAGKAAAPETTPKGAAVNGNSVRPSPARAAAGGGAARGGFFTRGVRRLEQWSIVNRQHPVAACKWANSRLNIGWGSIRVGLGMAISQSLFHFTQDLARQRTVPHES